MIHGFPTLFTYITSIYHYDVTLEEIIQSENFLKRSCPIKKTQPQKILNPPNALPRERGVNIRRNLVKEFDFKRSSILGRPTKPIIALLTHPSGIQQSL
jgi:hypothetical protein